MITESVGNDKYKKVIIILLVDMFWQWTFVLYI